MISISLNASNAEKYQEICHCKYGKQGFDEMIAFAKESVKQGFKTILTVVDTIPPEEIEKCGQIARKVGAEYRVRQYSGD